MMISQEDEIPTNLYNNNTGRNDRNVINPDQHQISTGSNIQESPDLNRHDILHGFIDTNELNRQEKEEQNRNKQGEVSLSGTADQ